MRFFVDKEETAFFQSHGWLELETEPFSSLLQEVSPWLESTMDRAALKVDVGMWSLGRDLWRQEKKLDRFLQNPLWSQIFSTLSQKKPIRLGLDMCFTTQTKEACIEEVLFPLEEKYSIQNLLGGVLFCLKPRLRTIFLMAHPALHHDLKEALYVPSTEEEAVPQLYYFLGLTSTTSQYQPVPKDPFRDWLKTLGIVVGGTLTDKTHPILYR